VVVVEAVDDERRRGRRRIGMIYDSHLNSRGV